jgi:hypothetical protein
MESNDGMILTEENRRTQRETYFSTTISTTNSTRTNLGAKPDLRGENIDAYKTSLIETSRNRKDYEKTDQL